MDHLGANLQLKLTSSTAVALAPLSGLCKAVWLQKTPCWGGGAAHLALAGRSHHPCVCVGHGSAVLSAWKRCRRASLGTRGDTQLLLYHWQDSILLHH